MSEPYSPAIPTMPTADPAPIIPALATVIIAASEMRPAKQNDDLFIKPALGYGHEAWKSVVELP